MAQLSGKAYVAARLRDEPLTKRLAAIKILQPHHCDHTETVCPTRSCVESWSLDWELFFARTGGGRSLYLEVYGSPAPGVEPSQVDNHAR